VQALRVDRPVYPRRAEHNTVAEGGNRRWAETARQNAFQSRWLNASKRTLGRRGGVKPGRNRAFSMPVAAQATHSRPVRALFGGCSLRLHRVRLGRARLPRTGPEGGWLGSPYPEGDKRLSWP
jgi:hypothetical protein